MNYIWEGLWNGNVKEKEGDGPFFFLFREVTDEEIKVFYVKTMIFTDYKKISYIRI